MNHEVDPLFDRLLDELEYICPNCSGYGKLYLIEKITGRKKKKPCQECGGTGVVGRQTMDTILRIGPDKMRSILRLWAAANGCRLVERQPIDRTSRKRG